MIKDDLNLIKLTDFGLSTFFQEGEEDAGEGPLPGAPPAWPACLPACLSHRAATAGRRMAWESPMQSL